MADLEGAASETLDKLRALGSRVGAAHEKFAELGNRLKDVAAQVDADWAALTEQTSALLDTVTAEHDRLDGETREGVEAANALATGLQDVRGEAQTELDDTRGRIAGFAEQVTANEPTVTGLADTVRSAFESLGRQAAELEQQLESALGEARDFLQDEVAGDLRQMQDDIEERGDTVSEALDECAQLLTEAYDEWTEGLDEVEQKVEEAFEAAGEHLGAMVEEAMTTCRDAHEGLLAELADELQELEGVLGELAAAADSTRAETSEAAAALEQGLEGTQAGLEEVRAKLENVKQVLARYTFVQL